MVCLDYACPLADHLDDMVSIDPAGDRMRQAFLKIVYPGIQIFRIDYEDLAPMLGLVPSGVLDIVIHMDQDAMIVCDSLGLGPASDEFVGIAKRHKVFAIPFGRYVI